MTMGNGKNRRQRAVRLTDEALDMLNARCLEEWESLGLPGRLSRARKAGLLGVGISTLDKIHRQEGNDLSALMAAFSQVGIAWDDTLCEPVSEMPQSPINGESILPEVPSKAFIGPRQRLYLGLSVVFVVAFVGLGFRAVQGTAEALRKRQVDAVITTARAAYEMADYEKAHEFAQRASRIAHASWDASAMVGATGLRAQTHAAEGRLEEALALYKEALALASPYDHENIRALLLEGLGVTEARLGHLVDAERHLLESLDRYRKAGSSSGIAVASRGLGSLAAVRRDFIECRQWYAAASHALADRPDDAIHVDIKALKALVRRDQGEYDGALRDLQVCLAFWEKQGQRRWQATTLMQIASVHRAASSEAAAQSFADRAQSLYESVGDQRGARFCAEFITLEGKSTALLSHRLEEFF